MADTLPAGFRMSDLNHRLLSGERASIEGLMAIGDPDAIVPDVERTIRHVRTRLMSDPRLSRVTAGEVGDALGVPLARAERLLVLMSSLGMFIAGASGSPNGYSDITLDRDDVVQEYLGFRSIPEILAKWSVARASEAGRTDSLSMPPSSSEPLVRNRVFIVMSMDPGEPVLAETHDTIREVCRTFGLVASRIDDIEHEDRITDQTLKQISSSEFILADVSGERPNVYYEIGFAHALGKHPILIRRTGTPLHFDLLLHKVPEYSDPISLRSLLHQRFEAILGRSALGADANLNDG